MTDKPRSEIAGMEAVLEELWALLDGIFAQFTPSDWRQPHGPDWLFSDLPYHLGYIDRLVVAEPLQFGPDLPLEKQVRLGPRELHCSWNGWPTTWLSIKRVFPAKAAMARIVPSSAVSTEARVSGATAAT